MGWFRNANTQAQVNTAIAVGLNQVEAKQAEVDRLRNESAAEAARIARKAKADLEDATRLSRRRTSDLEDKIFDQSVEIANAKNAINQWLVENEAFKRLGLKYSKKAGVSVEEFQKEVAMQILDVKEELALKDVPIPKPPEKIQFVELDYTDPNNTILQEQGCVWLESHGQWATKAMIEYLQARKTKP